VSRAVVVVSGTTTGVGKTWVAARLLEALRERGIPVAARKPVQSFDPADGPTDADVLANAAAERPDVVCRPHRSYERPLAPPMAAELLGKPPFTLAEIASEIDIPDALMILEGVGGPRSPLARDGDTAALARQIGADAVVLVADPSLGAINAVVLSVAAFDDPPIVFLNRFDPDDDLHLRNRAWLSKEDLDVVTDLEALTDRAASLLPMQVV
jgi:dethiobiotin synthetase